MNGVLMVFRTLAILLRKQTNMLLQRFIYNTWSLVLIGKSRIEHVLSKAARSQTVKHNQKVANNREGLLSRVQRRCRFCE